MSLRSRGDRFTVLCILFVMHRWIADVQRYMLLYLSWICFASLLILIATYVLELGETDAVMSVLYYFLEIPIVIGTFALRKVISNVRISFACSQRLLVLYAALTICTHRFGCLMLKVVVRYLKYDRGSTEYDARIFVVTEAINVRTTCYSLTLFCPLPVLANESTLCIPASLFCDDRRRDLLHFLCLERNGELPARRSARVLRGPCDLGRLHHGPFQDHFPSRLSAVFTHGSARNHSPL